jgi:membrane protein YqaA with SNARE-associated domain
MVRRTWEWFQARAASRHAQAWLVLLSFSESSFFLIPPDILLIPLLAARAGNWLYYVALTTGSSVLGALFGYVLAAGFFELVGQPIIDLYGLHEQFAYVGALYNESTFWAVFTAAFTPIPFKVFVLAGGFFTVPFIPFIVASILGRGLRFLIVGYLAHRFGPQAAELFLSYFNKITIAAVALVALGLLVYVLV